MTGLEKFMFVVCIISLMFISGEFGYRLGFTEYWRFLGKRKDVHKDYNEWDWLDDEIEADEKEEEF